MPHWPQDSLPVCTAIENVLSSHVSSSNYDYDGFDSEAQCTAIPPTSLAHAEPLVVQKARNAEALLCPQLVVNCTGIVDQWIFLSDRDDNSSVILSVWREIDDGRFVVVGANRFFANRKGRIVETVGRHEQFKAVRGDFIGIFYEEPDDSPVVSLISPLDYNTLREEGYARDENFDCFAYQKYDRDIRKAMRKPGFIPAPRSSRRRITAPPAVGLILKGPLTCENPPKLENGKVHAFGDNFDESVINREAAIGQKVVYSCPARFRLDDSDVEAMTITCGSNGRWKPEPPKKCFGNCPNPPEVKNSVIKPSYQEGGPQIGDSVSFECLDGFTNVGPPAIVCQEDFTWSQPVPSCVKSCGQPPAVDNAILDIVHLSIDNDYDFAIAGDKFSYSCDSGFIMAGINVITCNADGQWDPPQPPRCTVLCDPIPIIENARVLSPSVEVAFDMALQMDTPVFTSGDKVVVQCEPGFVSLLGETELECDKSGHWKTPLPQCVGSCGNFPHVENSRLKVSSGEKAPLADPLVALVGHKATIECAPGWTPVDGFDVITCHSNGTFGRIPVCEEKRLSCRTESIPYVPNSILMSDSHNGTEIGSKRFVTCLPGFVLQGESAVTCLQNGTWSEPPKCVLVDCGDPPSVMTAVANKVILDSHNGTSTVPIIAYEFNCQYGYELIGKSKVTCQGKTRTWSELPRCIDVGNPLCRVGSQVPNEIPFSPLLPAIVPPSVSNEPILADAFGVDVADLSICPSMRAVCTGEADRWVFLSQRNDGAVVIFGIWRPLSNDRFQLVGSTRWTANSVGRQIITLDPSNAIRIQTGDVIGVHYEIESNVPVVPSIADHERKQHSPFPSCYRLPLNDADVAMAMASVNHLSVGADKHSSPWNRPAVQLLVRPARGCPAPASLTHGRHNFDESMSELDMTGYRNSRMYAPPGHTLTYICDSGYQLAGANQISCQIDGTWAPSVPICVPETPNCRVGYDWTLSPLPEKSYSPGRWMTMYPSMRFGCSAEVVEWKVQSVATSATMIFIDVWRKVTGDRYELVGSNNFTLSRPGITSLRVPTSSRIMVNHDYFIGVHYAEIEQDGKELPGAIAHWNMAMVDAANLTNVELHDFMSRRISERDLRSEIVGYHYISMQHSQKQHGARTPAIVAYALSKFNVILSLPNINFDLRFSFA